MDIKEQLKDIKTQLRLSMNGAVSQSMREKGLVYKLNFGVELPRIKMIAEGYEKSHDLAQALWKEEIRNVRFWRECFSRLTLSIPKSRIFGWKISGISKSRN